MKIFGLLLLVAFLALVCAAPAPAPAGDAPTVSVLKYKNDQDLEAIQRQIIAQYEQLGGTTQIHQSQVVSVIDPNNLRIQH